MSKKSKREKTEILAYTTTTVDLYCTKCEPIEFFNIEISEYYKLPKKLHCPYCGKKSKIKVMD